MGRPMCYLNIAIKKRTTKGRLMMRVTSFEAEDQEIRDRIDSFMTRFTIGALLSWGCCRGFWFRRWATDQ